MNMEHEIICDDDFDTKDAESRDLSHSGFTG